LPISIGIGESKTLAKIANKISKKNKELNGILNLDGYKQIDSLLANVPVNDVWGIGRRTARKLERYGINTAKQLKYADDMWILKKFGVTIQRTVWELRGQGVEHHDSVPEKKKGICNSRSFGRSVYSIDDIKEAVSDYVTTAAVKLRKQNSVAGVLLVYLRSHNFLDEKYYSNLAQIKIAKPTNDTLELISYAIEGIEKIFKKGYNYKKTGVILTDIISSSEIQDEIFDSPEEKEKKAGLMKAMDLVNKKFGWKKLRVASSGIEQSWWMRSNMRTPAYTTDWKQIPRVKA
jgi:DNA polymerase V